MEVLHRVPVAAVAEHTVLGRLTMVGWPFDGVDLSRRKPVCGDLARGRVNLTVDLSASGDRLPVKLGPSTKVWTCSTSGLRSTNAR